MIDDRAVRGLRAFVAGIGPGDVVGGRWEVLHPIGEGAMGEIHAGRDRETGDEVAIKVLFAGTGADQTRALREATALASVCHPAIVRYVAHGVHGTRDGRPFVVMDRLAGITLAERLRRGPLSIRATIAVGRQLAAGLAAVHAIDVVHRDIKPSNVFLVGGSVGDVRLIDFGLARHRDTTAVTKTGALVGTPGYMAPEQVRGDQANVGPAADLFALGCVLWECATGRPLFTAEEDERLFARILLEEPEALASAVTGDRTTLDALSAIVTATLRKDAVDRPTAAAMEADLGALEAGVVARGSLAPPSDELAPGIVEGSVVDGKYRVESLLGAGGMGIVVAAHHLRLGTRVALKLLRATRGDGAARVLREARAASRLESAHVARVLDVGLDEQTPYIVMEHLSGIDLADRLVRDGPLPIATAVAYALETCEAIAEAHALGIVHRDLKPSNLFVVARRDGTSVLKVLDFGISKSIAPDDASRPAIATFTATATDVRTMMGSIPYMSPEQLEASRDVDARTDVWSLGVVIHELLTGARPFDAATPAATAIRIATAEPVRLRAVLPDAPAALEQAILRCLEKDRTKRHPSLAALARALETVAPPGSRASIDRVVRLLGEPAAAPAPRLASRRRGLFVVAGAALVAALGVSYHLRARTAPVVATVAGPSLSTSAPPTPAPPPPPPPDASSAAPLPAPPSPPAAAIVRRAPAARTAPARKPERPQELDLYDPSLQSR